MSDREPLIDVDRLLVLQASLIADREMTLAKLREVTLERDDLRRRQTLFAATVAANEGLREEVARLTRERNEAIETIESVRRLVSSVTRKVGP